MPLSLEADAQLGRLWLPILGDRHTRFGLCPPKISSVTSRQRKVPLKGKVIFDPMA
eukprot:SAG25_NODE_11614_length_300_cov_0.761194_1_plen_55_part_10